jgi:hypothetical protein
MFVKLPIADQTLPNWSGFSHAAVQEQMPPLDRPPIARPGRVGPQLDVRLLLDGRQNLFQQEADILVGERVVLEGAVARLAARLGGIVARVDEHADRDRHVAAVAQVIEDDRDMDRRVDVPAAVLKHHDRGRRPVGFVLGGDINPPVTDRVREDLALPLRLLREFPLRHVGLRLRVRVDGVILDDGRGLRFGLSRLLRRGGDGQWDQCGECDERDAGHDWSPENCGNLSAVRQSTNL